MDEETVPCKICELPTRMTYTQLCDNCWEIRRRLGPFIKSRKGREYIETRLKEV